MSIDGHDLNWALISDPDECVSVRQASGLERCGRPNERKDGAIVRRAGRRRAAVTPPVARAAAPNRAPPIRRLFLFMLTSLMGWEQVDVVRIRHPDRFSDRCGNRTAKSCVSRGV